jgi:hypothetical protein
MQVCLVPEIRANPCRSSSCRLCTGSAPSDATKPVATKARRGRVADVMRNGAPVHYAAEKALIGQQHASRTHGQVVRLRAVSATPQGGLAFNLSVCRLCRRLEKGTGLDISAILEHNRNTEGHTKKGEASGMSESHTQ